MPLRTARKPLKQQTRGTPFVLFQNVRVCQGAALGLDLDA